MQLQKSHLITLGISLLTYRVMGLESVCLGFLLSQANFQKLKKMTSMLVKKMLIIIKILFNLLLLK